MDILGTENEENLLVQTESAGYHEIKIYNTTRDKIWELSNMMAMTQNMDGVLMLAKQIYNLLLRSDSIWSEIKEGVSHKTAAMKIKSHESGHEFVYNNELKDKANEVKKYIDMEENPSIFIDKYREFVDKDYKEYMLLKNMPGSSDKKIQWIKNKIQELVLSTDIIWGRFAARINLNMPLTIREEKDIFFRGR